MKNKFKKIAIYCDLDHKSGLGHIKRMEILYKEFKKLGHDCFFILNSKKRFFIKKYSLKLKTFYFKSDQNKNDFNQIVKFLKKSEIDIIILDSYIVPLFWERKLIENKFFVVSIDDHLKKHYSNLVVTNKESLDTKFLANNNQTWLNGLKYLLVKKISNKFKNKDKKKNLNVLLHAGASSSFKSIKNLAARTIISSLKYNFNLTILCTNISSKNYMLNLITKIKIFKNIRFINYTPNLVKNLRDYHVVVGPAGTTTFEAIQSGILSFTCAFKNDGRDDEVTWHTAGHLMHLNEKEKNNIEIIDNCWDVLIHEYENLLRVLKKNSKKIDGFGPKRLIQQILILEKNKNKNKIKIKNNNNKKFLSCVSESNHARIFLNSRNYKKTRQLSSNPNHIISWPEHLKWWLNSKIIKNTIIYNDKPIAFHWSKKTSYKQVPILISGWFLSKNVKNDLNLANKVLKFQFNSIKKKYKSILWIIVMKKENSFVERLNRKFGFIDASTKSEIMANKIFNNKKNDLHVMEMKL